MTFTQLAVYFEKLEGISSRLQLTDTLASLLCELKPEEIADVVYLTQGRVAPAFKPIEIGMGEKLVAQALAEAFGVERSQVLDHYGRLGDLGLAAQSLAKEHQGSHKAADLSVSYVVSSLREIARATGDGTVQKRVALLSELLAHMDAVSVKHFVRIPLGNLRLGIGDPTVLDALSVAKVGNKSLRKVLETAYNKTSDLGLIARVFWREGEMGLEKLTVHPGNPIRPELCERLPTVEKVIEKLRIVAVEPKLDGFRTQIHLDRTAEQQVRIFSRNLEDMSHMFPEIVEGALRQLRAKMLIMDAEALAYNPKSEEFYPFQETTKRRRKYDISELAQRLPLKAFVFDLMYLDGEDLTGISYQKRRELIFKVISDSGTIAPIQGIVASTKEQLDQFLAEQIQKGFEGVVVKRLDSPYSAGARNFNWVKLKRDVSGELNDTFDCVILGYISGKGKRVQFGAGALLAGVYDDTKDTFVTICKIGTGLSDEEWREIHERCDKIKVYHKPARVDSLIEPTVWVTPKVVIEVLADEITRSPIHTAGKTENEPGYALRFPRLVSFRSDDKKPEDATTVKEIVNMFQQQGKH